MPQRHDGRLKVGVIGGGFGRTHLMAYRVSENVEIAAFCQRTRSAAEGVAKEFHIPHVFADYRQLLDVQGLDAVSIAAPPYLHYPIAMAAMDRGIHVLCEKPLALNRQEAETMVLRAEETKRVHMTAFNFRFIPAMTRMKELLEEGYVGDRIYHVDGVWFSERRADLNASLGWRYKKELAAIGALGDVGVHLIDLIRWLVGDFRKVCAHAATFTKERSLPDGSEKGSVTVEDACVFIAELAGEVQAAIQVSGVAHGGVYQGIRIFGNKGVLRLEIDRRDPDWLAGRLLGAQGSSTLQPLPIPERLTQGLNRLTPERTTGEFIFANLTRRFVEAIRTGRQVVPSFRDGLEAQKVIDAILKSAEEEQWVKVV